MSSTVFNLHLHHELVDDTLAILNRVCKGELTGCVCDV